jgi:hypothetical protein
VRLPGLLPVTRAEASGRTGPQERSLLRRRRAPKRREPRSDGALARSGRQIRTCDRDPQPRELGVLSVRTRPVRPARPGGPTRWTYRTMRPVPRWYHEPRERDGTGRVEPREAALSQPHRAYRRLDILRGWEGEGGPFPLLGDLSGSALPLPCLPSKLSALWVRTRPVRPSRPGGLTLCLFTSGCLVSVL